MQEKLEGNKAVEGDEVDEDLLERSVGPVELLVVLVEGLLQVLFGQLVESDLLHGFLCLLDDVGGEVDDVLDAVSFNSEKL